jgi:serine/threonine protein kinase
VLTASLLLWSSTFCEELGRGAYGLVLRVQSNETKESFAAKIVNKRALKKVRVGRFGNALQSVKKELAIWQKFKHRHIVLLREVIDTDGSKSHVFCTCLGTDEFSEPTIESDELYMISELVDGGPVLDGETYVCL